MRLSRKVLGIAATLGAVLLATPAGATTIGSSYTSTWSCGNGLYIQGHYTNNGPYVRADGMAASISSGYLRRVLFKEQDEGTQYGSRDVSYTGSATSVVILNTPTSYMPWMTNYADNRQIETVQIWSSSGATCAYAWPIGQP